MPQKTLDELFERARKRFSSYRELASHLGTRRGRLWDYRRGVYKLPLELFEKLTELVPPDIRRRAVSSATFLPANWGRVKGGCTTYERHPSIFEKGRRKGLKKLRKASSHAHTKYPIDLNLELSEGLCEFIGAFIGDGHTTHCNYLTQFAGHRVLDKEYHERVLTPLGKELFNISPHVIECENTRWLNYYSKDLHRLLTVRFCMPSGKKHYTVKIPREILESNQNFVAATLRGITDTDGTVFFDKRKIYKIPYPRVQISTSSRKLASQVSGSLVGMGFSPYLAARKGRYPRGLSYIIEVYGWRQLRKWLKEIGFSNQTRLNNIWMHAPVAQLVDRN